MTAPAWTLRGFIQRHLSPADRLAETLCGLIMVLSFTLVAAPQIGEGPEGVRKLLLATLGCNLAWGVIDGALYVLTALSQRAHRIRVLIRLKKAPGAAEAVPILRAEWMGGLAEHASTEDVEKVYRAVLPLLAQMEDKPRRVTSDDLLGGLAILAIEVACTIPAALPFLFVGDRWLALRLSNGLLLIFLFAVGYGWGKHSTGKPLRAGLLMLLLGALLVAVALVLGG